MAGGHCGRGLVATAAEALLPFPKRLMGRRVGIRTPPGLTQEQETLLGLGLDAEVHSGHDITGPLSNRFHFCDRRGRRLCDHSQGSRLPPMSLHGHDRQTDGLKLFLWALKRLKPCLHGTWNGTPGCDVWTGSVGPYSRLESAAVGGLG